VCPFDDLLTKPQPRSSPSAFNRRNREIAVALQVRRDAVAVAKAQQVGDLLGVDEVVGVDGRGHEDEST
jgi:hypothetical protein